MMVSEGIPMISIFLSCVSQSFILRWRTSNVPWKQGRQELSVAIMLCSYLSEPMRAVSENVASLTCDYGDQFSLQICGDYSSICFHFARGRNMPDTYGIIFFICRDIYLLTMLFIFEDDEPALCFLRLLTSSTFPSFGFKTILLLPAVPSDEDRSRLSINLPSRYGLKLLARTIRKVK